MPSIGTVSELWRYPISSLGGERLNRVDLDDSGVRGDRTWSVTDTHSGQSAAPEREKRWRPVTQLRVRTTIDQDPEIELPDGSWVACDRQEAQAAVRAQLGFEVELRPNSEPPGGDGTLAAPPRYTRAPLHLITTAALDQLRMTLSQPAAIDPRRFRPNIVIATNSDLVGVVEHGWLDHDLLIGAAVLRVTGPCARCSFPNLAQRDLPGDDRILRSIAQLSRGDFGVLCDVLSPASIAVGQTVVLRESGSPALR